MLWLIVHSAPPLQPISDGDTTFRHGLDVVWLFLRPVYCLGAVRFVRLPSFFGKVFASDHFVPTFIGFSARNHNDLPALEATLNTFHFSPCSAKSPTILLQPPAHAHEKKCVRSLKAFFIGRQPCGGFPTEALGSHCVFFSYRIYT